MLLATEEIIWTVPAPQWARRLAKELTQLSPTSNDKREQQRRKEISQQLPLLMQYRFHFGTVTIKEELRRDRILKPAVDWFTATYQIDPPRYARWFVEKFVRNEEELSQEYPEGEKLDREEAAMVWGLVQDIANWATFVTCLNCLEYRKVSMLEVAEETPWAKMDVPVDWLEFESFRRVFPRKMLETAVEVCNSLNPGIWETQMDEDSKNFGGVNVRG